MDKQIVELMMCSQYTLALELARSQLYNIKELYIDSFKQKFKALKVFKDIKNKIQKEMDKPNWQSMSSHINDISINNAKIWIGIT